MIYKRVLVEDPKNPFGLYFAGIAASQLGFHREAIDILTAAGGRLVMAGRMPFEASFNLAVAYNRLGHLEEAEANYRQTLLLKSRYVPALTNLGACLLGLGRWEEALHYYDLACQGSAPRGEPTYNRAFAHLLHGRLREGFRDYEDRWRTLLFKNDYRRPWPRPYWNGRRASSSDDVLVVYTEQGLGDTVQFSRFLPALKERWGGVVLLEAQPALVDLLAQTRDVDGVVGQGTPFPNFRARFPLLSSAYRLGVTVDALDGAPYLAVPPRVGHETVARIRADEQPGKLRVGLVWGGNPKHKSDALRSIPLETFGPLFHRTRDAVDWVSLQVGRENDLRRLPAEIRPRDAGRFFVLGRPDSFAETARVLTEAVDLVVSVDTSVVHLAGALGVPCACLVPIAPDWRWLLDRADSPWYKSVRLYRQPARGDWLGCLDRLAEDLTLQEVAV